MSRLCCISVRRCLLGLLIKTPDRETAAAADFYSIYSVDYLKDVGGLTCVVGGRGMRQCRNLTILIRQRKAKTKRPPKYRTESEGCFQGSV